MPRFIVSVWEDAKVQYEVVAARPDAARDMYATGEVTWPPLIDEHEPGEVADVTRIGG